MRFHHWYFGIVIVLFPTIVSAVNCTPLGAIGKISNIVRNEGSAVVIRAACPANERTSADFYQMLYEGDRIEIMGATKVFVSLVQREESIFTQETNHQRLHGKTKKDIEESSNSWFERITSAKEIINLIGKSRKPIPYFGIVRGSTKKFSLSNDPLLPSGTQYLPSGYDSIALIWKGGPATVIISQTDGTSRVSSHNQASLLVPIQKDPQDIRINLQDQEIAWHVQVSATPPLPAGMTEPDPALVSARLIRAIWILREGPVEWRMFALSEFANLSKAGIFAAEELWEAALSGELATALQAKQIPFK
jgi:hypothetical protein